MTKKGVRVIVSGAQRRNIDVEAMTQIIIALGRELAERTPERMRCTKTSNTSVKARP